MQNLLNSLLERPVNQLRPATNLEVIAPVSGEVLTDYRGKDTQFFDVEKLPLSSQYGDIANKKGIFVNRNCINTVSNNYEIHQPTGIFETFKNIASKTNLEIKRVITNPANGGLMISAKFAGTQIVGEDHDVNLTFYTSHCSTYKTFLTLDLLRIACFNQAPALVKNKGRFLFAEKHYQNALNLDLVAKALEYIPESVEAYNAQAEILQSMRLPFADFQDLYIEHYKLDQGAARFDSKMQKAKAIYYRAPGQETIEETSWKAFQAVTFANTHEGKNTSHKNERVIIQGSNDSQAFKELLLAA